MSEDDLIRYTRERSERDPNFKAAHDASEPEHQRNLEEIRQRNKGYNTAGYTKEEYKAKLEGMTDEELFKECKEYIWLSAFANNNPRSAFHWMCDMTYDEASRRGKVDIYSKAHNAVAEANRR